MTQHSNSMNSVYDRFPTTYTFHNILHLYDEMSSQFDKLTAPTTHMNIACQTNIANSIYDVHYLKTVCTVTVFNGGGWKNHSAPFLPRPDPIQRRVQYYYRSSHLQNTLSTRLFTKKTLRFKGIVTDYDQKTSKL